MVFSIFAVVLTLICWKSGNWRNWKEYYSTILYLFIGSIVCGILLYQQPLWSFNKLTEDYPILEIFIAGVLYPSTVILYLSNLPQSGKKMLLHILLWGGMYTVVELCAYLIGDFLYFNGWNIVYTLVFNLLMFPLITLHHKKPLYVWPISVILAFIIIWYFKIPLAR